MSAGDIFQAAYYCCADTPAKERWMDKNCVDPSSMQIDHATTHNLVADVGKVEMLCRRIMEATIGQRICPRVKYVRGIVSSASGKNGGAPKLKEDCLVSDSDMPKPDGLAHFQNASMEDWGVPSIL